jgi:hypothetical protein
MHPRARRENKRPFYGPQTMRVPENWKAQDAADRAKYSSKELDDFHNALLCSEDKADLMHGLLSVVFWGFASGSDGRVNPGRALSRSKAFVMGRKKAPSQAPEAILSHLRNSREALHCSRIAEALLEAMKIKFVQMSFASKLLTFMNPKMAAVYDQVISKRLESQSDAELRSLFVFTGLPTGNRGKNAQAKTYEQWCFWCSEKAASLNNFGITWIDWNGSENTWRAVDVERAFFALGRSG